MTNSDTRLEVDCDYLRDRLRITISIPAGRWRAAVMNCSIDTLELLNRFAFSGRLADLFMHLAILFMDEEAGRRSPSHSPGVRHWGFSDGMAVRQVRVEVVDHPRLPPLSTTPHSNETPD